MRGHMSAEDYNNQLEAKCPGMKVVAPQGLVVLLDHGKKTK